MKIEYRTRQKPVIPALVLAVVLICVMVIGYYIVEESKYAEYHQLAIAACEGGDMEKAYTYIDLALQYAKDPNSISEGRHDRNLFDHNMCSE